MCIAMQAMQEKFWWKLSMAVNLQPSGSNDQIHGEHATVRCMTLSTGPKSLPQLLDVVEIRGFCLLSGLEELH